MIRQAEEADLPVILEIYAYARDFMAKNGNPHQWAGGFPPISLLQDDIGKHNLYVVTAERVCGVFFFAIGPDETYSVIEQGEWFAFGQCIRDDPPDSRRRDGAWTAAESGNCEKKTPKTPHLRIDTHEDNHIMQHVITQCGFRRCGIIHVSDGTPRNRL